MDHGKFARKGDLWPGSNTHRSPHRSAGSYFTLSNYLQVLPANLNGS